MAASVFIHLRSQAWTVCLALGAVAYALLFSAVLADQSATLAAQVAAAAPEPLTPAPAPKPLTLHDKVVAALRAANHYGAISGLLDSLAKTSIVKEGTTLFAPDDGAFNGLNMNSTTLLTTTLNYHVATQVYNYNQLSNLPLNSTIPTEAPDVVIFVTSTGKNGLRVDNVAISDPDIYADGQVAVHGVSAVMDTAKYNTGLLPPAATPAPLKHIPSPAPSIITTPTTPKTSAGTTPTTNAAAPAIHVLTRVVITLLPVCAVSFIVALL